MELSHHHDQSRRGLITYLKVLAKRKRMIVGTTILAFCLTVAVSLALPRIYCATARILPPQQDQGIMGALLAQAGGLANLAADVVGGPSKSDLYAGMLRSEAIKDAIIDRFKLMEVYEVEYRLDMHKMLDKLASIEVGKKDGIISICVEDKDPKRAAAIANAYVGEIDRLTVGLNTTGAAQNKGFLEDRLARAKGELARAEDSLKVFQAKNKAIQVPEQAKATIEGVSQLRAQLAIQEVQLATLRRTQTDSAQDVKNARSSVANLRGQIATLEGNGGGGAIPSLGSVPALGQEYVRLMRDYKTQEALVELLTKQYEMAKLSEVNNVSSIQVIQKARVPDKKIKPKRTQLVFIVTYAAFMVSVILAFILERFERMPEENRSEWKSLRRDFTTFR